MDIMDDLLAEKVRGVQVSTKHVESAPVHSDRNNTDDIPIFSAADWLEFGAIWKAQYIK